MEFEIKNNKDIDEKVIELWLEKTAIRGEVILAGKDKRGIRKDLILLKEGKFRRYWNAELEGLETDEKGRIIEEK